MLPFPVLQTRGSRRARPREDLARMNEYRRPRRARGPLHRPKEPCLWVNRHASGTLDPAIRAMSQGQTLARVRNGRGRSRSAGLYGRVSTGRCRRTRGRAARPEGGAGKRRLVI